MSCDASTCTISARATAGIAWTRFWQTQNVLAKMQRFLQNVIISIAGGSAGIYESGPKSLLKALLLRVALGHDYPPEKKNINSVHQMLKNPGERHIWI